MKKIVICADDYGQNSAISQGIRTLLKHRRINAASCLINTKYWKEDAQQLRDIYTDGLQVGLHLNLTEGRPLTSCKHLMKSDFFKGLNPLLFKAFSFGLKKNEIYQELKSQLEQFIKVWGGKPDFLDGHQHIHHLPVVRDVVLALYDEFELSTSRTWIRSVANMVGVEGFKPKVIVATGAKQLEKKLIQKQIPHNTTFSGAYDFDPNRSFAEVFEKALENITDGGEIMCHPGEYSDQYEDLLKGTRKKEFDYFMSDAYYTTLQKESCKLFS